MCFSAAASFITGGALSAAGIGTLRMTRGKRAYRAFASIPLLFGIQQIIEGVVWVTFDRPRLQALAAAAYAVFSHAWWPMFLPVTVWMIEPDPRKKRILFVFVCLGAAVGLTLLLFVLRGPVGVAISGHGLTYLVPFLPESPLGLLAYVLPTCGACMLSSHHYVKIFGLTLIGSLLISYWSYSEAFASVWCFFAAILSLIVYVHLRHAIPNKNRP